MRKVLRKKTTDLQCAGLVASIGCPRRLEICNEFGRKLPRRRLRYTESDLAAQQRMERSRVAALASGWIFEAAA
jgi:hypothetical protein